jgi:phosphoribosylamine--glycine ligase
MAAAGYPAAPRKGDRVQVDATGAEDLQVFHAGTTMVDGELRTSGGRVLCVTALGDSVKLAQQRAYDAIARIHFDGAQWRTDIGHRALKH